MEKLSIKLENCYGIKKLNQEFDFTHCNANLIYAKNGSMKTSFAKVFSKIQEGKEGEIKDEIHNNQPIIKEIKIKNSEEERAATKEDVFVIKSFVPSYQSESIESLLINSTLKEKLDDVLKLKQQLLKKLEKISGIKISSTSGGKKIYKLEPQILEDFNIKNESFLKKLSCFKNDCVNDFSRILYSVIFDAIDIIKSDDFQNNIEAFLTKSDEVYINYSFLQKGEFTLAKLKEVQKRLNNNNFFVNDNKIKFGSDEIDKNTLKNKIKEIEDKLQDTNEFKELEKLLQKPKGIPLKDLIEKNPHIIEKLKIENLDHFKRELWESYIQNDVDINDIFNELKTNFSELESEINSLDTDNTKWQKAIKIFNDRFFMPFRMDISNLEASIMGDGIPKIVFKFPKDGDFNNRSDNNWTVINRDKLEEKDTLSQGEKRALYLLNIIFDIEKLKKDIEADPTKKVLFIIDDIADSFDYKNKYAIVEYLQEISEIPNFYSIILTHNFDFFRTVQERIIKNKWEDSFIVQKFNNEINLNKAGNKHIINPFALWKGKIKNDLRALIPSIPFVRNLIEFRDGTSNKDYLIFTYTLHQKNSDKQDTEGNLLSKKTNDIKLIDLEEIFNNNLKEEIVFEYINEEKNKSVIEVILSEANDILSETNETINIGDKIILSIASRLLAEKYMWNQVSNKSEINGSQTGKLYQRFKDEFKNNPSIKEQLRILNSVNIMTPENIHIN